MNAPAPGTIATANGNTGNPQTAPATFGLATDGLASHSDLLDQVRAHSVRFRRRNSQADAQSHALGSTTSPDHAPHASLYRDAHQDVRVGGPGFEPGTSCL